MSKGIRIEDQLEQGEPARLIPVVADTSKEQRVTSALLAVMTSVDEFGKAMLKIVGVPILKRSTISCYTEVILPSKNNGNLRPDGLITVKSGSKIWTALIEAKVRQFELKKDQVEAYLDLAKENNIDAVITISNQFAPQPTHHPLHVNKLKLRHVELYHWSWTSILSEAVLVSQHKGVSDPDQAYILNEFIRYLHHDSSGVNPFPRLGKGWKDVCARVQHSVPLAKNSDVVIASVGEWHQLVRYLSLKLSMSIVRNVNVYIKRTHSNNPSKRLHDAINDFVEKSYLDAEFEIPDAASRVSLIADLSRRSLSASMRLQAPRDKTRATAAVNWLLRQMKKSEDGELIIRAIWPGRMLHTGATLWQVREDPKTILNCNLSLMPVAFEVVKSVDLGARFKGAKTFVEEIVNILPTFYGDVGQHLKTWIPPAPKLEKDERLLKEDKPSKPIISETTEPSTEVPI